ncbi:MAG: YceI family protein [Gemmatimonadales bacterium]
MTDAAEGAGHPAPGGGIVKFKVDTRTSRFTIQAFAGGMLSAIGHDPKFAARDYTGEIECNPETGEGASLKLNIKAASLQLLDDFSSKDKQTLEGSLQGEVLDSAKYPEIVYDSPASSTTVKHEGDGPFTVTLNGSLTLHGVTRRLTIPATVFPSAAMIRANGEFTVRQSDFQIQPVSVAGGTLKVKDELKCTFDIVARP